jgi:D-alanyl-D-alanine dipeptidase
MALVRHVASGAAFQAPAVVIGAYPPATKPEWMWIPCSEKMPEPGTWMLAYGPNLGRHVSGPSVDVCLYDGDLWVDGGTELADESQSFTHWMPITKPD